MVFIPNSAKVIFDKLEAAGKEAYLVGGCVRDTIMGKNPHDYDFTTNAEPTEVIEVFKDHKLGLMGLFYGTVVVNVDGDIYEITTYRTEGEYSDSRHPDEVFFAKNIEEDLSRRDFTMNAIAYSPKHGFVDPYNGISDINNKIIRCVRDADMRFKEDAIRIIRGIRFSAQMNFSIEEKTLKAMFDNQERIKFVSKERYLNEFRKIMMSNSAAEILDNFWDILFVDNPEFLKFVDFDQKHPHHAYNLKEHTIRAIKNYSGSNYLVKIGLLFHDIGKPWTQTFGKDGVAHYYGHGKVGAEIAESMLYYMRYEKEEIKFIKTIVLYHDSRIPYETVPLQKWIIKYGEDMVRILLDVSLADCLAHHPDFTEKRATYIQKVRKAIPNALKSLDVPSKKDLDINGNDIMNLGFKEGKIVGEILDDLFDNVLYGFLENKKEELLKYVVEKYVKK